MRSWVGDFLQHLKKVHDGRGRGREEAALVDGSRAVTKLVEKDVVSATLGLHSPECLRVGAPIVHGKVVPRWALVASILSWL